MINYRERFRFMTFIIISMIQLEKVNKSKTDIVFQVQNYITLFNKYFINIFIVLKLANNRFKQAKYLPQTKLYFCVP